VLGCIINSEIDKNAIFGIDHHDFMNKNDPIGLFKFIDKYKNDNYGKLQVLPKNLKRNRSSEKHTPLSRYF